MLPTLKVIRITALSEIIKKMDVKDDVKAIIKAAQLLFNLLLYIHMKACIYYFVCDYNKLWKPTNSWYYYTTEDGEHFFENNTIAHKFWIVYYTSAIMLKGNELGPRTEVELLVGTFMILFNLITVSNILLNL